MAGYVAVLSRKLGVSCHFPILTTYLVLGLFTDLSRLVVIGRWGFSFEPYKDLHDAQTCFSPLLSTSSSLNSTADSYPRNFGK